jgi:LacI family transcriptional regulator
MKEADSKVATRWLLNGELNEGDTMKMTNEVMPSIKHRISILCADHNMTLGTIATCEELGYLSVVNVAIAGYGDY